MTMPGLAPPKPEGAAAANDRGTATLAARPTGAEEAGVGEAERHEEALLAPSAGNGGIKPNREKTAIMMLLDLQKQIMNEGGGSLEADENEEEWEKAVAAAMQESPGEMLKLMREGIVEIGKPRPKARSEERERSASSARRRRRE